MVHSFIRNQWYLKQTEYDQLIAEGKATKLTWWCKNLTTGQFFNYDAQIGHRISGNAPFEAELDLEEGEYMFSVGDYNVIDPLLEDTVLRCSMCTSLETEHRFARRPTSPPMVAVDSPLQTHLSTTLVDGEPLLLHLRRASTSKCLDSVSVCRICPHTPRSTSVTIASRRTLVERWSVQTASTRLKCM